MRGTPTLQKRDRFWLLSSEMLKTAVRRGGSAEIYHRGGFWKDMVAYISKDHLIFGMEGGGGTEWRKRMLDFRENADF